MATENKNKSKYTTEDMLADFVSPIAKVKATDLSGKGDLMIKGVRLVSTEKYGESYVGTFEDDDGNLYDSFIQAKQPFAVFDKYKDALIGSVVKFNVITTRDGNTILKMHLVTASKELDKVL